MIVDAIRSIIMPVLLLAVVIVIGLYYNQEAFRNYVAPIDPNCPYPQYSTRTGGPCTGDPDMKYDPNSFYIPDKDPYLNALGGLRNYQYALQGPNNGNTNLTSATAKTITNAITNTSGSNVGSNITSNTPTEETSIILNNILWNYGNKILDNSTAELSLEIDYDGRGDWPEYTSDEHEQADKVQDDCINRREIKEIVDNELACQLGRNTGNQMYYDEGEEEEKEETAAVKQGAELAKAKKDMKCPTIDTNQWIRKDSIPCWGCDIE